VPSRTLLFQTAMNTSSIELWRVDSVVCDWLTDWRRIRVRCGDQILSDQTFKHPAEALESARELRAFFKARGTVALQDSLRRAG
jgi:hypothetical protein